MEVVNTGGVIMYPLIACSFIALLVIMERGLFWLFLALRSSEVRQKQLIENFTAGVEACVENSADPIIRVIRIFTGRQQDAVAHAVKLEVSRIEQSMHRSMKILDTIISIAPMLGILGTVVGMIISFNMVGGQSRIDPDMAMSGIAQAFLTTAAGLVISICSLILFNYFSAKIEKSQQNIRNTVIKLEGIIDAE